MAFIFQPCEGSILEMRKLRFREAQKLTSGHRVNKRWSGDSTQIYLTQKPNPINSFIYSFIHSVPAVCWELGTDEPSAVDGL